MKRFQMQGLGSKKRQAESLTMEEGELLWENQFLGDDILKKLWYFVMDCILLYEAVVNIDNFGTNLARLSLYRIVIGHI